MKKKNTSIKKILSVYSNILSDPKIAFGHKIQKSADFKYYLDNHLDIKEKIPIDDLLIITMYANLNKMKLEKS